MDDPFIEELSMNHWPSLSTLLYDGWVLRFAYGYTKRANSISPIYDSTCDLYEKITACESIYSANQLPTIYKISPFVRPAHLDRILEARGYSQMDLTSVQTLKLEQLNEPTVHSVKIDENSSAQWIDDYCRLNTLQPQFQHVMTRMLSNIRTPTGFISFYHEDQVVACGFGVIEREYIGLYDIVTDIQYRNRGFGKQMILHLLTWGKERGAKHSYLAVVSDNAPARRLYSKLGYSEVYRYWYRVSP